jgi:hypothetical protein
MQSSKHSWVVSQIGSNRIDSGLEQFQVKKFVNQESLLELDFLFLGSSDMNM